jgi:hypothetical protein
VTKPDDDDILPARWGLDALDLTQFKKIDVREVRFLWVHDYYDGALSGALVHREKICWFEYCGESANRRRYVVLELTSAELDDERHWHALFEQHVGDHWTTRDDGSRGSVRPVEEHAKFYEAYALRAQVDYSRNPILGWFEE